jgi:hypothetical protein
MRHLLWLTFSAALACTRANPNALGFAGQDLATPPLPGAASDLAIAVDQARPSASDMSGRFAGVACGAVSCSGIDSACCVGVTDHCTDPKAPNCGSGRFYECDGPEDCSAAAPVCCAVTGGSPRASSCQPTCTGVPLCHVVDDCPRGLGYIACCAVVATPFSRCSRTAC